MNLKQNLIITYSNQKARELKKTLKNPLDKVVTLSAFANDFFEKNSFKTEIKPIVATSFIYKIIKEEKIEYLDFISITLLILFKISLRRSGKLKIFPLDMKRFLYFSNILISRFMRSRPSFSCKVNPEMFLTL